MTNPMQYLDMKVIKEIIKIPDSTEEQRKEMRRILNAVEFGLFKIIVSKEEQDKINQIFQERPSLP